MEFRCTSITIQNTKRTTWSFWDSICHQMQKLAWNLIWKIDIIFEFYIFSVQLNFFFFKWLAVEVDYWGTVFSWVPHQAKLNNNDRNYLLAFPCQQNFKFCVSLRALSSLGMGTCSIASKQFLPFSLKVTNFVHFCGFSFLPIRLLAHCVILKLRGKKAKKRRSQILCCLWKLTR